MQKRIPIDVVSASYLAEHVAANMGLDVNVKAGKSAILAAMATAGFPTDYIEIDDPNEEEQPIIRVDPPRGRHTPGKRMVEILIPLEEKAGGAEPVWTNVNEKAIFIPRAKPCWVDYKYYEALLHAEAIMYETDEDSKIIGKRVVPQYPLTVLYMEPPLTEKEIAEMTPQQRAIFLNIPRDQPKKAAAA